MQWRILVLEVPKLGAVLTLSSLQLLTVIQSCCLEPKIVLKNIQLFVTLIKFKPVTMWTCSCLLQPVIGSGVCLNL
jgi:hypothetical protein